MKLSDLSNDDFKSIMSKNGFKNGSYVINSQRFNAYIFDEKNRVGCASSITIDEIDDCLVINHRIYKKAFYRRATGKLIDIHTREQFEKYLFSDDRE